MDLLAVLEETGYQNDHLGSHNRAVEHNTEMGWFEVELEVDVEEEVEEETVAAPTLPTSETTCVPTFMATLVQVSAN